METKLYNRKTRDTAVLIYLGVFIAYLTVSRIVPLTYAMSDPVDAFLSMTMAGVGGLLLVQDLLTDRVMFRARSWWILALYVVVVALSALTNIRYGVSDNIKTTVWFCIQFFLFYPMVTRFGDRKTEKFMRRALFLIGALWTVCVAISIAQYIFQLGYHAFMHEGLLKRQGFIDNRLFGLFSDPNACALMSLCLIYGICYILETDRTLWKRIVGIAAIILHFTYIILSGSRSIVICMFISAGIKTGLMVWSRCHFGGMEVRRTVIRIIGAVLVFCLLFFAIYLPARKGLSYLPELGQKLDPEKTGISTLFLPDLPKDTDTGTQDPSKVPSLETGGKFDSDTVFNREDVREDNMLNNRQSIWAGYLSSLHGAKWIFGLSPRNAIAYISEHDPDNYIAQVKYIAHSDYIGVIAYTGLAGVAVVLLFGILALIRVFKKLAQDPGRSSFYQMSLVILCAIGIFGMSYMDILFCNTITGVFFWMMAGIALNYGERE